jgi:uncharacterized protein (UPF0147 family)
MLETLFSQTITRDISAVVYFHQQDPDKLAEEVSEYIITGGYARSDERRARVPTGIHECYVTLLTELARQLRTQDHPACWISGFYGSGKSSFAKLLGLALDGRALPDGTPLADAWLDRDRTPRAAELRAAWQALTAGIQPIAVVFDIGGQARDNEHIHATALRQVQVRLGYSKHALVAEGELRLEKTGQFNRLCDLCDDLFGAPWSTVKDDPFVDDKYSTLLHHLDPVVYPETMSWVDSHDGKARHDLSTAEAVQDLSDMLRFRAPDATLFIVVDEVSQYVHQDDKRMLKLQSFVSDLGQRLGGRAWLLVTGQEQLDAQNTGNTLGKMKDRFPPSLRVHLSNNNIRDVVHRRLLEKTPDGEAALRALFQEHRTALQLYAFDCAHVTVTDFVEVYPMLPGHVDLLLEITQALRNRATRSQGDDHAIRGLLQLLGELFRARALSREPVGRLITLDDIYAVQESALPGGTQRTMTKIAEHCAREGEPLALRAAQAVSLLELISEQRPTTHELVAQALYDRVDRGNNQSDVRAALERLRAAGLVTYSEKRGFKLQSSSGQEWETERNRHSVTPDEVSRLVQLKITEVLVPRADVPRHRGAPFKLDVWFTDDRQAQDVPLQQHRNEATFAVDLRFVKPDAAGAGAWAVLSKESRHHDRLLWVVGPHGDVPELGRALARNRYMVDRYDAQRASLSPEKLELLNLEQGRQRDLDAQLTAAIEAAFLAGALYFRGEPLPVAGLGSAFSTVLTAAGNRLLPDLYPFFEATNVTQSELDQLLDKNVPTGVSTKFLPGALGLLTLDSGRYEATADGPVPARLLQFVEEAGGSAGGVFFQHFSRPPFGFGASLLRACLAGLLRARKLRIRTEDGKVLTSHNDPGARDLFRGDRDLRRAELLPADEGSITRRDRVAIARFFKDRLGQDVQADPDGIADAVFQHFAPLGVQLRDALTLLQRVPGPSRIDPTLERLGHALTDCQRSRHIEPTVKAVKRHLDALNDGVQRLNLDRQTLTREAVAEVARLHTLVTHHLAQLEDVGVIEPAVAAAAVRLREQLAAPRPWDGVDALAADAATVTGAYGAARVGVRDQQVAREEAARARVRARDGFERLSADDRHQLLRPLAEPSGRVDLNAVEPTLRAAAAQAQVALQEAEAEAYARLDELLRPDHPTVPVAVSFTHREVERIEELDAHYAELRARVLVELQAGRRVRLR